MQLEQVEEKLNKLGASLERKRGMVTALASKGISAKSHIKEAQELQQACDEAITLLASYSEEQQNKLIEFIASTASSGLTQIFDEDIELKIALVPRAKRVEMDISVRTGELETPVMEARGGGLAAIAGFILRVCVLLLTPDARRLLVLDETFAHLSEEYLSRLGEFLRSLYDTSGMQIILITHQQEFIDSAHKVYEIEKVDTNTSQFIERENND